MTAFKLPDDLEFSTITVNGLRLHTVQAGPPDAPLVVLLHGFPEFWYGWRGQIRPLVQAGFRVVVPDQRGYNLSAKPLRVADYAIPHLVSDIHALVKSTGRTHCFLVGHDWGAAVAWETALRHPDMVARLCILNVPHLNVMTRFLLRSPRQVLKSWYIFAFQTPGLPEWFLLRNQCAGLRRMLKLNARPGTFSPVDLDEYVRAWSQPGALTAMINWYRAVFRSALKRLRTPRQNQPRRVSMPTLILWGEQDIALSKAMVQPSLDLCDQGRLVMFPNATHWVQHDEAEAVSANLVAFLKS